MPQGYITLSNKQRPNQTNFQMKPFISLFNNLFHTQGASFFNF